MSQMHPPAAVISERHFGAFSLGDNTSRDAITTRLCKAADELFCIAAQPVHHESHSTLLVLAAGALADRQNLHPGDEVLSVNGIKGDAFCMMQELATKDRLLLELLTAPRSDQVAAPREGKHSVHDCGEAPVQKHGTSFSTWLPDSQSLYDLEEDPDKESDEGPDGESEGYFREERAESMMELPSIEEALQNDSAEQAADSLRAFNAAAVFQVLGARYSGPKLEDILTAHSHQQAQAFFGHLERDGVKCSIMAASDEESEGDFQEERVECMMELPCIEEVF